MSAALLPALALVLLACAALLAFAALAARSLFATCVQLAAAGALIAAMLLVLNQGAGAVAVALMFAGWAPVLLLAAMLLTARTTGARSAPPWLSIAGAGVAIAALSWAAFIAGPPAQSGAEIPHQISVWFAPLLLAVAAGCAGLLGHGERGALDDQVNS